MGKDKTFTLSTNTDSAICYAVENHAQDCRVKLKEDGICESLTQKMGTGGGNTPIILIVDSHPADSRIRIVDTMPTIPREIHKGGAKGH